MPISIPNCGVLCNPSMVKKKRESLQLPVEASNANTTTVPIFNGTDGANFFSGPVQEGRWEGNIENEEQSCVWVARLVGFPFFFTTDGPKLRQKIHSENEEQCCACVACLAGSWSCPSTDGPKWRRKTCTLNKRGGAMLCLCGMSGCILVLSVILLAFLNPR